MIQFTHSEFIMFLFGGPFVALIVLMLGVRITRFILGIVHRIKSNKRFKEMYKKVEEMKAAGDFHEWINMPLAPGKVTHVCKKTGFCPEFNGFFEKEYIDNFLKLKAEQEEYEKFRSQRLTELAGSMGLKFEEMDDLVNNILSIKRDFHVKKLNELAKELKDKMELKNE